MKISTSQIFDKAVSQMNTQQGKVAEMQAKLATGKQLVKPSDDSDKAGLIQRLNSAVEQQQVYENSLNTISNRLAAEETALMSTETLLQRVRELGVQASNDTLTARDRQIIALEVSALRDEFLALANTQDMTGNYIFSGSMVNTPAFAEDSNGDITYQGDDNLVALNVSEQRSLVMNRPGDEIFASVLRTQTGLPDERVGFFSVLEDFITGLETNDASAIQLGLAEVSDLTDSLALSLADVGSRLEVVDSQRLVLTDTKTRYEMLLSDAQDLDYASAVTKLSSEIMSLEAAQSSFMKISQLSLFNFLR
jgi:flagellar hook-associated protein 3 FlgL